MLLGQLDYFNFGGEHLYSTNFDDFNNYREGLTQDNVTNSILKRYILSLLGTMKFQLLLVIMVFAVATFNSFVLMVKPERHISGYKLLYSSLFFYNFCLAIYYVWFEAGFIMDIPQLLRIFSPLMYFCAPCFYFFLLEIPYLNQQE
jgi:hypothetical protein